MEGASLYDDLDEYIEEHNEAEANVLVQKERKLRETIEKELTDMKRQLEIVLGERDLLEQNIANLHATAVLELKRKDDEIAKMSKEILRLKK